MESCVFKNSFLKRFDVKEKSKANEKKGRGLATDAHITKSVIGIFFRKNVIRSAFGCFQNMIFLVSTIILNSTNPIDKVNFNIIKSKNLFIFFKESANQEVFCVVFKLLMY